MTRGEVEVDALQSSGRFVRRIWLEPPVSIHPTVAKAISEFDAAIVGPGSFYTSLMPIFLVRGVAEALANMKGPVILIANLLTEGRGMVGFTAADAVARIEEAINRKVDVVITNMKWPSPQVLAATRSSTRSRSPRVSCRRTASSSAAHSGPATSRATIACASRMRCGVCSRVDCSGSREAVLGRPFQGRRSPPSPRRTCDQLGHCVNPAALHDATNISRVADVLQRVAADEGEIRALAWPMVPSRRRAQRAQR